MLRRRLALLTLAFALTSVISACSNPTAPKDCGVTAGSGICNGH